MDKLVLITGATGTQGGAVVRAMLQDGTGWRLRALVRNPDSDRAKALAGHGVELVRGDLSNEADVVGAVAGAYGVYSVQTPMKQGPEGEERQGKLLATAASSAGVQHFVYSSVAGAERNSGVPHFESKWRIEQHVRGLGLPATIVRPVMFMDNFATFAFRTVILSMMKSTLPGDRPVQLVAAEDIGAVVAHAFATPDALIGRAMELAGDAVTRTAAKQILSRNGLNPAFSLSLPKTLRRQLPEDFTLMFDWIAGEGFQADIPALRRAYPTLHTLAQWAENQQS